MRRSRPACIVLILAAAAFAVSCAHGPAVRDGRSSQSGSPDGAVYLTNRTVFKFLSPGGIEAPMDMLQRLDGAYGDREFSFMIYVLADASRVEMIVLNDLGSEMARIVYDGREVTASGLVTKAGLSPNYILADFQLAWYRLDDVSTGLAEAGLTCADRKEGAMTVREIFDGGKAIISIEKGADSLRFRNILRGYSYTITFGEKE
jgi:hypothetical protein